MNNVLEKNQLLSLPEFERARKYWLGELDKKKEETRLPYSYYVTLEYEKQTHVLPFDTAVHAQLEKASKGNLEALFILLTASYRILLHHYAPQQGVQLGIPTRAANKDQSFLFSNEQLLPVYCTVLPEHTFKEVLKVEKEGFSTAYQHQHYPLDEIENNKIPKTSVSLKNIHTVQAQTELDFVFEKKGEALELEVRYNGKLFSSSFIQLLAKKYQHTITCLLSQADVPFDKLSLLEKEEEDMLLNVLNKTISDYPLQASLVTVFKEWVAKTPNALAVVSEQENLTYRELDLYSDKIAHYLSRTVKIEKEELVGILIQKSHHTIATMLGILKAGGGYLPISPRYPAERIRMILNDSRIKTLLSSKDHIKLLNKVQWECPQLTTFLCIDSFDCQKEKEETTFKNELNSQKLWEHVGETATDDIEGGGWQNSYTGENISRAEMDEYRDNIVKKLRPLLHKEMRVLEIGCASGISMFELAPTTALYYGTDLSRVIIEKNKQLVTSKGISNIKLKSLAAHEIDQIEEKEFDLVIINSVIQCFEGHNYFKDVIGKAVHLLKDKGLIFLGDVMDEDTRETFVESLQAFKKNHLGKGYKTKTDFSNEIFYSRAFFEDLRDDNLGIQKIDFSDKIRTIENELTLYRYDALLLVDKKAPVSNQKRHKFQHSLKDLNVYSGMPYLGPASQPHDTAYVIYTSGSTGKPKGVIVSHKNVLRVVQNTNYVTFEQGDKLLQSGPMEFDASTFEIWGALTNGLSLHIIDSELLLSASKLKKYIEENKITTSFMTTAAFIALVEQDVTVFDRLKHLLVGGESMSTKHFNKLLQHNKGTKIHNIYGPTENTVFSTSHLANRHYTGAVPIGRPISNSTCYVLDKNQRLVMPGAEGELYVGGDGVAKGYLNSPELTQQRFVPHPFKSGEKLYYTGDLVRWNENYEIEYVGRVDTQVKIRGFRIELSEIENEILHISDVKEVRVVVKKDQNEDKSLVGYFVASTKLEAEEIISILTDKLPDYMIPKALVQLEALPLNANGKLDVAKLPDPVIVSKSTFEAPVNEAEEQLAEIWKEVLSLSVVSRNDNFFDLGGHSLKAMKVLHKLSKDYELKLTTLFKYPTIKELAQNLVYKKGNLLETFKRLKQAPLSESVIQKANERKSFYRERIQKENLVLPGEEQEIKDALLTGTTGFLGIHLLYELLTTTSAQVHILIRAENDEEAKERLLQKIEFFFGSSFYYQNSHRIHVHAGEMEKPLLGLEEGTYRELANTLDTIINPAANVKHYGQEATYQGNTIGVEELVKLAKEGQTKRLHHVSTAGVSFGQGYVFSEYDRVDTIPEENNTIYLQSKLDAEKIIFKAMEEGVEATVFRVGNLVFNNKTGKFQENTENSAFYMLLRSFINLGIMPDMTHKFYDFSFINTTAEAIVKFAKQKGLVNDVYHVYSTHAYSLQDLYHQLIKPNFPHVELVSLDEFPELILQKYEDPKLKEFIEHIIVNVRILEINESNVMLVSERTQAMMDKLEVTWQKLDAQLGTMMIDFGKQKRFW